MDFFLEWGLLGQKQANVKKSSSRFKTKAKARLGGTCL